MRSTLALLLLAAPLAAQPRLVLPGDSLLDPRRLGAGTHAYTLTAWQGAASLPLGRITDRQWRDSSAAGVVVQRVLTVQRGGVQVVDSTATDARTLAPRRHVAQQPTRRFTLAFTGRRVKGSLAPEGFPGVPVDTLLATPFFDASNWDLVLRALPLAPGVHVQLPVYDLDGGLHPVELRVTGRATVLGEAAHVVVFTLAANRETTVWIGAESGRLLRMETLVGGVLLEQRLVAEPPPEGSTALHPLPRMVLRIPVSPPTAQHRSDDVAREVDHRPRATPVLPIPAEPRIERLR